MKTEFTQDQLSKLNKLIDMSIEAYGTNYMKVLIEGNTGIWYVSPTYLHRDYNKHRAFEKNEVTIQLIPLFYEMLEKKAKEKGLELISFS